MVLSCAGMVFGYGLPKEGALEGGDKAHLGSSPQKSACSWLVYLNLLNVLSRRVAESDVPERTAPQPLGGEACTSFLQRADTTGACGGQQERWSKAPDPPITTVACKHVWGGLIPPSQQECVFGCKFLPAVKSEKTLISSPCPPVPPAGNDTFTRGSSLYRFPAPPLLEHMEYIVVWGKYILRISPASLWEHSRADYSRCRKISGFPLIPWAFKGG